MRTISGVFDTLEQGEQAVAALENAGIASSDVSLVAPGNNEENGTGATLVTATVDEEQADVAEAILGNAGAIDDITTRQVDREGSSAIDPGEVLPGDRITDDRSSLPPLPR